MSQLGNMGAPTPRRSGRISNKANSVAAASDVTQLTSATPKPRRQGPLTKVKPRKSNAYGASGRVGAAEQMSVSTTGFSQAFESQRVETATVESERVGTATIESQRVGTPARDDIAASVTGIDANQVEMIDADSSESSEVGLFFMSGGLDGFPSARQTIRHPDGTVTHRLEVEEGIVITKDPSRFTEDWSFYSPTNPVVRRPRYTAPVQERPEKFHLLKPTNLQISHPVHESSDDESSEDEAAVQPQGLQEAPKKSWDESLCDMAEELGHKVANYREANGGQLLAWSWWKKFALWALYASIFLVACFWPIQAKPVHTDSGVTSTIRFGSVVASRLEYTWGGIVKFIRVPPPLTYEEERTAFAAGNDNILWGRMEKMNRYYHEIFANYTRRFSNMDAQHEDMRATLDELRQKLPEVMLVHQYKNGRNEITDDFWHALIKKASSSEKDPAWQDFLKQTRTKLVAMMDSPIEKDKSRLHAISRDEFVKEMERHYQVVSTRVDKQVKDALRNLDSRVQAEARKTAMASIRLHSLAQTNLLANYELHMKQPNYFSIGLGAYVDAMHTSTTFTQAFNGWLDYLYMPTALRRNPPAAALVKWEEPGDCWCAAPTENKDGQLQLAITMEQPIFPKQLTIEHVPKSMVPRRKIDRAPRDVELWVQTDGAITPTHIEKPPYCDPLPSRYEGWQCMGRFRYDIHGDNHVQTFDIGSVTELPVRKTLLRVANNWGAEHTCLYRVRLHGDDAQEDHVYTVQYNDKVTGSPED
ncbi:hypothetical protein IQ07DRAFT_265320 [Pyrenochaeta sp. DS3sAY3a]|nr:hypothetical protein IQ07DRAFT_265320 [Pyrenochaeta sp. DS3sAY3a]